MKQNVPICDYNDLRGNDSIDAVVSIVNAAAAMMDSFLFNVDMSAENLINENGSIDSELRHLADSEEALRRELDGTHLLCTDAGFIYDNSETFHRDEITRSLQKDLESSSLSEDGVGKGIQLPAKSDLPQLGLSSPASSISATESMPPVSEVKVRYEPHQCQETEESYIQFLREYQFSCETPNEGGLRTSGGTSTKNYNSGLKHLIAGFLFGRHEYKVQSIFSWDQTKTFVRTKQGSVSVALASAIAVMGLRLGPEITFYALAIIPSLVTLLEIHLPHRIQESDIALFILVAQYAMRKILRET